MGRERGVIRQTGGEARFSSFTVAMNIGLTVTQFLNTYGRNGAYDYSLVWGMTHGWIEGESTGTFDGWVFDICK